MKEPVKILELKDYQISIVVNALHEFRNRLIRENIETEDVDTVLLKALDAPEKKSSFVKKLKYDNGRR